MCGGITNHYYCVTLQVTRALILSMVVIISYQPPVTAACLNIPANVAPLLDCIPNLSGICLGEQVKCLRNNSGSVLLQPQLSNLTAYWDDKNTLFTSALDRTPCSWTYEQDHDFNRYPQYINNARCNPVRRNVKGLCVCKEVKYTIPVLRRTRCDSSNGEQRWEISSQVVSAACAPHFIPS